jgi:AraC-type DNA-binding domain-containing proteins
MEGWSLLLPPDFCDLMPGEPTLVAADSFLSALLARLARSAQGDSEEVRLRLIGVLLDAFLQAPTASLQLLLPDDKRARMVAQQLLAHPDDGRRQAELAAGAGLSVRTLSRLFVRQTGLTFARWRQQARVLRSLEGLAAGLPVAQVAMQYGYDNTSAYIAVFRQRFGVTPGAYFLTAG